ncbi:MAG: hypothetical protein ACO1QS_10755 [Verrucomicrobiota bacterium]
MEQNPNEQAAKTLLASTLECDETWTERAMLSQRELNIIRAKVLSWLRADALYSKMRGRLFRRELSCKEADWAKPFLKLIASDQSFNLVFSVKDDGVYLHDQISDTIVEEIYALVVAKFILKMMP